MEKFILRQKWLGLLAIIFVSLFFALDWSGQVSKAYIEAEPIISQEAGYFLPIRFFNGEIVSPQNTLIERTYGSAPNSYKVVLNTEVEDLNISELTSGIYLTRNKVYSYDAKKGEVKIQSLAKVPDMEISKSDVDDLMLQFGIYLKPLLGLIFFAVLAIYMGIAILIYTLIMHWLFKKVYNADFALTLRVNTLTYVAMFIISVLLDTNFGIIITILIMLAFNYLANILLTEAEKR